MRGLVETVHFAPLPRAIAGLVASSSAIPASSGWISSLGGVEVQPAEGSIVVEAQLDREGRIKAAPGARQLDARGL
jgi:hypothetical protein